MPRRSRSTRLGRLRLLALAALIAAAAPARAQTVAVYPNLVPLDGTMTIQGSGFPPFTALFFNWDGPAGIGRGIYTGGIQTLPITNALGSFSFPLDHLPYRLYPADVGRHTLAVGYLGGAVDAPVDLAPRQGWAAPAPLPTTSSSRLASGLLAFVREAPDGSSSALVVTDGAAVRVVASTTTAGALVRQPRWSPDGTRLAFTAMFEHVPHTNVYVLDRAGRLAQLTFDGGEPPRPSGGGAGAVAGTIRSYVATPPTRPADVEECQALFAHPEEQEPAAIHVNLVGTGRSTLASRSGDGTYPFRLDGVPAGEYWIDAWYNRLVCQESTTTDLTDTCNTTQVPARCSGAPLTPCLTDADCHRTLVVHRPVAATPNVAAPARVAAGATTTVGSLETIPHYSLATGPSWADDAAIVYTRRVGSFESAGDLSEVWSVRAGSEPSQLSSASAQGPIDGVDASPVSGKVILHSKLLEGLYVADPGGIATAAPVTSAVAILLITGTQLAVSDANPVWAPDGSHVAFTRAAFDLRVTASLGDLWIKDVATGVERRLTRYALVAGEGVIGPFDLRGGRAAWSPDRSQVAVTYTAEGTRSDVRVINVADGSAFGVTSDGASLSPAWTGVGTLADFPESPAPLQPVPPETPPGETPSSTATVEAFQAGRRPALRVTCALPDGDGPRRGFCEAVGFATIAPAPAALQAPSMQVTRRDRRRFGRKGRTHLTLKLNRAGRRALKAQGTLVVTVRVTVNDRAGQTSRLERSAVVRRRQRAASVAPRDQRPSWTSTSGPKRSDERGTRRSPGLSGALARKRIAVARL